MLKLKAKDVEDLQVISAILQDAIVPVVDMAWTPQDKSFVMVAQRLRRETGEDGLERICCAVNVRGVEMAQIHSFDLNDANRMLDLLAVILESKGDLLLVFAGEAKIRLKLNQWSLMIEDFGEAWPAKCNPCHDEGPGFGVQGSGKR